MLQPPLFQRILDRTYLTERIESEDDLSDNAALLNTAHTWISAVYADKPVVAHGRRLQIPV